MEMPRWEKYKGGKTQLKVERICFRVILCINGERRRAQRGKTEQGEWRIVEADELTLIAGWYFLFIVMIFIYLVFSKYSDIEDVLSTQGL